MRGRVKEKKDTIKVWRNTISTRIDIRSKPIRPFQDSIVDETVEKEGVEGGVHLIHHQTTIEVSDLV